ncbi:MAG: hypothetical protein ACR2IE_19460 [Candidatus Sumerlaeaceae bacterium]
MQVLRDMLLFGWIALLQGYAGRRLLRFLLPELQLGRIGITWLGCVAGNGMLAFLLFALGVFHLVSADLLMTVLVFATVITGFFEFPGARHWKLPQFHMAGTHLLLLLAIAVVAVVALGGALSPEVRGDAIIYHISEALLFSVNHGHVEIPGSALTYIPQYQQLLYAMALTLGTDILAKLFHWWAGVLLLAGTYAFARMLNAGRTAALGATALLALFPIWTYLATSCYVDLATANYTLAAVALLVVATRNQIPYRVLALSGAFVGLAMGTKYTAIINAALPAGTAFLYVLMRTKATTHQAIVGLTSFTLAAFLVFSPWLLRNFLWTGNPVAPSLMRWLGPAAVPESTLNWPDISAVDPAVFDSPLRLLSAYTSMLFSFSDYGNYLPLIAMVLAITLLAVSKKLVIPTSPEIRLLLVFLGCALLLGVPTMTVRRDSRYVMAHMAIVAVLIVLMAERLILFLKSPRTTAVLVTSATFLLMLVLYALRTATSFRDLNETIIPPLSQSARAAYLRQRLTDYDANTALSSAGLPANLKVYGAAYPARVHYVMTGAALTSDLQLPETQSLRFGELKKLKRQQVGFIFGDVPPALQPLLQFKNRYGGKPLYEIP